MAAGDKLPTYDLFKKSAALLLAGATMSIGLNSSVDDISTWTSTSDETHVLNPSIVAGTTFTKATCISSTISSTADAVQAQVTFTFQSSQTVYGHFVTSADSTAAFELYSFYAYAAAIPCMTNDTLTCTNTHQYKIGV